MEFGKFPKRIAKMWKDTRESEKGPWNEMKDKDNLRYQKEMEDIQKVQNERFSIKKENHCTLRSEKLQLKLETLASPKNSEERPKS